MNDFDTRVAFYTACAISQGKGTLTMALIRNTITAADRPAVRAARLMVTRGSGRDRRERIDWERAADRAGGDVQPRTL